MSWLSLDTVNYFLFLSLCDRVWCKSPHTFSDVKFSCCRNVFVALHYCRRKDNCTLLLYMHILCFQLTKGWKTLFVADLFSHSFCGPSALGSHCGLVIYRTIYHNIHGNHNWITPALMWSQLRECSFTCVAVFTCLFFIMLRLLWFALWVAQQCH